MADAFEPRPEAQRNAPTDLTDSKVAARRSWFCAAACCCGFLSLIVPIFAVGAFALAWMGWKSRDRGLAIGGLVMASVAVVLAGFGFYARYQAQDSMRDLMQTVEYSGPLVGRESAVEQLLGVIAQTVMMCSWCSGRCS